MWQVPVRPMRPLQPRGDDVTDEEKLDYVRRLENHVNNLEQHEDEDKTFHAKIWKSTMERTLAILIIHNSDKKRYSQLQERLRDGYSKGRDEYPSTLNESMRY